MYRYLTIWLSSWLIISRLMYKLLETNPCGDRLCMRPSSWVFRILLLWWLLLVTQEWRWGRKWGGQWHNQVPDKLPHLLRRRLRRLNLSSSGQEKTYMLWQKTGKYRVLWIKKAYDVGCLPPRTNGAHRCDSGSMAMQLTGLQWGLPVPTIPHSNTTVIFLSFFYFLCTLPLSSSSPGVQTTPCIPLSTAGTLQADAWEPIDDTLFIMKSTDTKQDGFEFLWSHSYTDILKNIDCTQVRACC